MALTKAHNRMIASQVANVDDYGAVGDGVTDDTSAIQACLADNTAGEAIEFTKGKVYIVSEPLNITANGTNILGNNARIVFNREQDAVSPSVADSLWNISADLVVIKDIRLQYTGTFNVGGADYGGFVSGIQVNFGSDDFYADNVTAYGFNRCGINVGYDGGVTSGGTYCKRPTIHNCHLYENRVVGVAFGQTEDGSVSNCVLEYNGSNTSAGTGYGFAGWSGENPKNTVLEGNRANYNWRKGLDFHSGENGVVTNNICSGNAVYGIYVEDVTGNWTISSNTINDMDDDNVGNLAIYGIYIGSADGQGTGSIFTSYVIDGNVIDGIEDTDGNGAFSIFAQSAGLAKGNIVISNNICRSNKLDGFYRGSNTATDPGDYYDISFVGNHFIANETTADPIYIRTNHRQRVFSNNVVQINTAATTQGVVVDDVTTETNYALTAVGNTFSIPASLISGGTGDVIYMRRLPNQTMTNNIVNGAPVRDWDGYRFTVTGTAAPTTQTWTTGSIVWNRTPTAGTATDMGFVCVTAGTPGTWKGFGDIAS